MTPTAKYYIKRFLFYLHVLLFLVGFILVIVGPCVMDYAICSELALKMFVVILITGILLLLFGISLVIYSSKRLNVIQ